MVTGLRLSGLGHNLQHLGILGNGHVYKASVAALFVIGLIPPNHLVIRPDLKGRIPSVCVLLVRPGIDAHIGGQAGGLRVGNVPAGPAVLPRSGADHQALVEGSLYAIHIELQRTVPVVDALVDAQALFCISQFKLEIKACIRVGQITEIHKAVTVLGSGGWHSHSHRLYQHLHAQNSSYNHLPTFFTYIPSSKSVSVELYRPNCTFSEILACGTVIRRPIAPSCVSLPFQIAPHPNSILSYDPRLFMSTHLCNVRNISKVHHNIL